MRLSEYLLLASATAVSAWLPGEHKSLVARDGQNLFNNDTVPSSYSKRWLPASGKIRGVNLGSQFIVEPWMASNEWNNNMGCNNACSEFDCVSALGQSQADSVWAAHWARWITQDDINEMVSYGLNTIRIPVGYWIDESLKYDSEHFPNGGLAYLEQICGWASDAGMYIIIDLHGAPYAQDPQQPFTGQVSSPLHVDILSNETVCPFSWLLSARSIRPRLSIPLLDDQHHSHHKRLPQRRYDRSSQ